MKATQKRLKEVLWYNQTTGEFIWKVSLSHRVKELSVAGSLSDQGYTLIGLDGAIYRAHRLVWLYIYGVFPRQGIDHITKGEI